MKLLHIADLHIGKRVCGLSMIEEQNHVIDQLASIACENSVAGVLIAGDVFDRPIPSREALETCERLFQAFCEREIPVFAIPGNHDSPQQLAFCSSLLASSGLHIAKAFDGRIDRFMLEEDGQRVCIHLLPFVRPTDVRMALPDSAEAIKTHEDAVRCALECDELANDAVNILVAHQFVTNRGASPQTCDSELLSVGGSDSVDASVFDAYDYVALGHLHGPQHIGREQVRYSGSLLKYSFSEVNHKKSATVLSIEAGKLDIETCEIAPLHDMREIHASYEELQDPAFDEKSKLDYLRVTLSDRSLPDAMAKLRAIYPNILRLDWDAFEAPSEQAKKRMEKVETESPLDLFDSFYELQTGSPLTPEERTIVASCIEESSR